MELDKLILTIVTFTPDTGRDCCCCSSIASNVKAIRALPLVVSLLTFVLSLHLIAHFDSGRSGLSVRGRTSPGFLPPASTITWASTASACS